MPSSTSPDVADKDASDEEKKPEAKDRESESRKRKNHEDSGTESEESSSGAASQQQDGKPAKNWKRIMANRKSARESRIRRIKYMETLEKSVEELTRENTALLRENQLMARENFALRQQVASIAHETTADAAFRQPGFSAMGARGAFGAAEGPPRLPPVLPPNRTSLAASRSALSRPILDMPHPGLDIPPTAGYRGTMPPMPLPLPMPMPPVGMNAEGDQFALEMMRRRRKPHAPPTEEEKQLIDMMRRRRQL